MNPTAATVKNTAIGSPSSSAAVMAKGMKPSETMEVTGGITKLLLELAVSLSFKRRLRNGDKKFFLMESHSKGRFRVVASASESGRPSGIVSN
ncbi:unnamed protein product [Malus baccata var. baccata]|uniref:Uncharacterized protein n=1 Tax=Malus domestica TaxID=3750 RepID=A0A498HD74_MALDO|nr:hypothetical protein DVH24_027959 [Malus domestica]